MKVYKSVLLFSSAFVSSVIFQVKGITGETPVLQDTVGTQVPQMEIDLPLPVDNEVADTVENAVETESKEDIIEKASESYKKVRRLLFEDGPRGELYDAAYECYIDNLEGLKVAEPGGVEWRPCKSRLIDVSKIIEEGAFYYSSLGNNELLTKFAQAYVDTQILFSEDNLSKSTSYPLIVYIAASGAYNSGNYNEAIKYFKEYLSTGDESRREQIYIFLGQAALNSKNYSIGVSALVNGIDLYPTNYQMALLGIQNSIDGKQLTYLQKFLDKALLIKPNEVQLLNLQAALYQRDQQYDKALMIYSKLFELNPKSLDIAKDLATCYFNLGVLNYNKAIQEEDEKNARRYKRQANTYFDSAIMKLEEVIANDPLSVKYLKALAVCYGCIDDIPQFERINEKIVALGDAPVKTGGMPSLIAVNADPLGNATNESAVLEIPLYSNFGTEYVSPRLKEWAQKGEYETEAEYNKRVTAETIQQEFKRLNQEAQKAYLEKYSGQLLVQDLKLDKPYDTQNEVYQIESSYGPIIVPVPLKNHEAESFKSNFANVKIKNPRFYIKDNKVQVKSITFVAPGGKSYDSASDLAYIAPVDVYIDPELFKIPTDKGGQGIQNPQVAVITVESDVDKNIPKSNRPNDNTIALIIANENYQNVSKVQSALRDGQIFREYCIETLGIPDHNILYYPDASLANLITAGDYLDDLVKAKNGNVDVIVYYSGHGMPDEATREAFIVPIDGTDRGPSAWYSLNKFYQNLADLNANSVMVFVDACFSGSQRDGNVLMEARGIAVRPAKATPVGNMFILTATADNETAMPYKEKNHGMFTYFLLKKLQESKGNVTLKELSDYIIDNVKRESLRVNHKLQTPTVSSNGQLSDALTQKKLRP